jgi:hypothetical protein
MPTVHLFDHPRIVPHSFLAGASLHFVRSLNDLQQAHACIVRSLDIPHLCSHPRLILSVSCIGLLQAAHAAHLEDLLRVPVVVTLLLYRRPHDAKLGFEGLVQRAFHSPELPAQLRPLLALLRQLRNVCGVHLGDPLDLLEVCRPRCLPPRLRRVRPRFRRVHPRFSSIGSFRLRA